jgi:hypothetical protein
MENKTNITKKLLDIVKNRKTPLLVNKQDSGYNKKRVSNSLSHESYSYDSED